MLEKIEINTIEYQKNIGKGKRKPKGQFFTSKETALFMSSLFDFSGKDEIDVLDAGTGTGILSGAFVEIANQYENIKKINLTCYENDKNVLPVLKKNLSIIKKHSKANIKINLITDDYLLSQAEDFEGDVKSAKKYDFVISNPPYQKIQKATKIAKALPSLIYGAPNMYFLFAGVSLFNLKENGEMVYIMPRSWTSGVYFKEFRKYLLTKGTVTNLHLFESRDSVFEREDVLQETMILKVKKGKKKNKTITITSSNSNNDFNNIKTLNVNYNDIIDTTNYYVLLPTSFDEIEVLRKVNKYNNTMLDNGYKMRTGLVVNFRNYEFLSDKPLDNTVPLFYSWNIKDGKVSHGKDNDKEGWVFTTNTGLIQKNNNSVFVKRFTAKEEKRRLQCAVYCSDEYKKYKYISTQNKINFVEHKDGSGLSIEEAYGIFAILNSTLYDKYYRILNGSTQVNSTEINNMPMPPINTIEVIGKKLIKSKTYSTDECDKILMEVAYV